ARAMGITPETAREVIKFSEQPVSLEMPIGDDGDSYLRDILEDPNMLATAEAAVYQLRKEQVEDVLSSTLSEREARVLQLRFGLRDGRSRTLEEVGRDFGVTRERIRQIEAKALKKLRHPSCSAKLRDFVEYFRVVHSSRGSQTSLRQAAEGATAAQARPGRSSN
ncbi:MAG: hypothetical protein IH888_11120, partial [Planctomycetes bacterium]|nr:hypothetical protein [Planctomycetota bacterium]